MNNHFELESHEIIYGKVEMITNLKRTKMEKL